VGKDKRSSATDLNPYWTFNLGLGLYSGSLSWDIALSSGVLASSGALVNPAAQSSLAWSYP
jgi:hypothetical protein